MDSRCVQKFGKFLKALDLISRIVSKDLSDEEETTSPQVCQTSHEVAKVLEKNGSLDFINMEIMLDQMILKTEEQIFQDITTLREMALHAQKNEQNLKLRLSSAVTQCDSQFDELRRLKNVLVVTERELLDQKAKNTHLEYRIAETSETSNRIEELKRRNEILENTLSIMKNREKQFHRLALPSENEDATLMDRRKVMAKDLYKAEQVAKNLNNRLIAFRFGISGRKKLKCVGGFRRLKHYANANIVGDRFCRSGSTIQRALIRESTAPSSRVYLELCRQQKVNRSHEGVIELLEKRLKESEMALRNSNEKLYQMKLKTAETELINSLETELNACNRQPKDDSGLEELQRYRKALEHAEAARNRLALRLSKTEEELRACQVRMVDLIATVKEAKARSCESKAVQIIRNLKRTKTARLAYLAPLCIAEDEMTIADLLRKQERDFWKKLETQRSESLKRIHALETLLLRQDACSAPLRTRITDKDSVKTGPELVVINLPEAKSKILVPPSPESTTCLTIVYPELQLLLDMRRRICRAANGNEKIPDNDNTFHVHVRF